MNNKYLTNIEKAVLCAILFDSTEIEIVAAVLNINDFYVISHQKIYTAMLKLYEDELPIDENFIRKMIPIRELPDVELLNILSTNPVTNLNSYIYEIKEQSDKRKIDELVINIRKYRLDNLESQDIINNISKSIDLINTGQSFTEQSSRQILDLVLKNMELSSQKDGVIGQITGLNSLDNLISGFEDGDLIIISARPSMGKTSIISAFATQMLEDGNGVLIESLEMPNWKILQRLIASKSGEPLSNIKNGSVLNYNEFKKSADFFACENLVIHDGSYPNLQELTRRIKNTIRKNKNIKNIFIDHTGKIALEGKTREDIEIGYITNNLKKIARDFNIRVFLLQQLNRSVESRDNKRPMLSDLKNSGNIEEDADVVLGLYRDSYYKSKNNGTDEQEVENAEIIVLKNRDGKTGTAKVAFEGKCARFINQKELNFEPKIIEYKE